MKLLQIQTSRIIEILPPNIPKYAILSHTWDVVTKLPPPAAIQWAVDVQSKKYLALLPKIIEASRLALEQGIDYLWTDWLCIDSSSSASLEKAVNGALSLLQQCALCIVHLDDLEKDSFDEEGLAQCRYWTRSWTLQELIIPQNVQFYDASWKLCGEKHDADVSTIVSTVTGIPVPVLVEPDALWDTALAVRMSWAARRTCRREEDIAYSLLALAGVTLQVRYGEGSEATFLRFQEEVLRNTRDTSLLAWRSSVGDLPRGLLARSPLEFQHFQSTPANDSRPWEFDGAMCFNSRGIQIQSNVQTQDTVMTLDIGRDASGKRIGVYLACWNGVYVRIFSERDTVLSTRVHKKIFYGARHLRPAASIKLSHLFTNLKLPHYSNAASPAESDAQAVAYILPTRCIDKGDSANQETIPLSLEKTGTKRNSLGLPKQPGHQPLGVGQTDTLGFVFDDDDVEVVNVKQEESDTNADPDANSDSDIKGEWESITDDQKRLRSDGDALATDQHARRVTASPL
ncbi:hypothetical protein VHEMI08840 [[Torrubiella] hemipterigena]|uniref:Heterokaryon incompatibility domain-containing protein n=1 Tax=[Torrubiella] hemipterigena TaxID=1531966 RepID=A0A0A1TQG6_9HYPO|nr:hypothetical protein VHEMI08840 [[Torrubiella] hemipterigena]